MPETKDLTLRAGIPEDGFHLYRNLWSRPEAFRFMFSRPCTELELGLKKTAAYAQMHKETATEFFVYERASGLPIGIAGIKELSPGRWTVTDIAIGPDFQGRGYGKQILQSLLAVAFERGASEVAYACFTQNDASNKLAKSCGFIYSHSAEAELQKDGKTVVLDHFILTRSAYISARL